MEAPLAGIRVIDWTIWQQGPVATTMLADLGAEVIKIEEREQGDPGRWIASTGGGSNLARGRNFYFEANNRHKKSMAVNLKTEEGKRIVHRLAAVSDVFVQNFRQGVATRLGIDYAALSEVNPKIIYASASGYGPKGPDSATPAFDYMGQARSGLMRLAGGPENPPMYLHGGIADQMGAIVLAYGVTMALLARERYGVGQELDVSHLGSMIALEGLTVSSRTISGREMMRRAREEAYNPLWNHYKCADGKWICLGMLQTDRYWRPLCAALSAPELADDPRFSDMPRRGENCRELIAIFDRIFVSRTLEQWTDTLKHSGDFVFSFVNSISDLPSDPQVVANEYVVDYNHPVLGPTQLVGLPVRFSKTPGNPRGHAPEFGEHTEAVLTELLNYSWGDVAALRDAKVI